METAVSASPATPAGTHPFYSRKFAWLPIWIFEKGNKHNSATIAVRWLWFILRDASSIGLGFNFTFDFDRIHFRIGLPYVNLHFMIQFPHKWAAWEYRNLYRHGEESKYKWLR